MDYFKDLFNKYRNHIFVLTGVLILAYALISRIHIIGESSFWYDEAFTGILVKEDWGNLIRIIIQDKVHPPVYYVLLKIWAEIFGNTDVVLRAFSLLFGTGLISAAFLLIKRLFGRKAAIITSIIFTVSPFFILYSIEARAYMMMAFEVLITLYLALKLLSIDFKNLKELFKLRELYILILMFAILLLTHYLSIFIIIPIGILIVLKIYPTLAKIGIAALVIFLFAILLKGLFTGNFSIYPPEEAHTKWLSRPIPQDFGEMLFAFSFGVQSQAPGDAGVFHFNGVEDQSLIYSAVLVIAIVLSGYLSFKSKDEQLKNLSRLFLLSSLIVSAISLFGINFFLPRYLLALSVVFVMWSGAALSKLKVEYIVILLTIYFLLLSNIRWENWNKDNRSIALEILESNRRAVTPAAFDYLVLKYYLNGKNDIYLLDNPEMHMAQTPWAYFDTNKILQKVEPEDLLLSN